MVSSNGDARAAIRGWLQENVTGGRDVPNDEPLIDNGVMTSLQTVELVVFLEDTFGIVVEDEEFDEENFGSVEAIARLVEGDAKYTYEDLERQSSSLGVALTEAGVGRGDRVGVYLEKSWEAIVAMLAASRIGAAYVNVNPLFKAPQVEYLASDCDIRIMIGDTPKLEELQPKTIQTAFYRGAKPEEPAASSYVDVAEALAGEGLKEDRNVSESDLGTILYTSGSTGMPKGVSTSQRNVVVGAQIVSEYLENTPEDRILS